MTTQTTTHRTSWPVRLLCLLLSGLTACSTGRSQYVWHDVGVQKVPGVKASQVLDSWGATPEGANVADPTIIPGFLVTLHSFSDSKLNGDFRVGFNGDLQLPYDITVNTSNMTLTQLKSKLGDVYRPYFKTPSDIDVKVKERRYYIDIRGLVEKPGRYLVEPESSLDLAIGMAGGITKTPAPLYVRIQKGSKMFVLDLNRYYNQGEDHPQILGWIGGEILFFQKEMGSLVPEQGLPAAYRMPIYMLGEVKKPGEYILAPQSDFVDSLVLAGGFTDRADLDNIEIVRRTGGRKRVYNFSWENFQAAPSPQQGDVILVHADNTTKGERHISLAATIIGAAAAIATSVVLILAYNRNGLGTR